MDILHGAADFVDGDDFDTLIEPTTLPENNASVAIDLARRGFAVFPKHYRRSTRDWTGDAGYLQSASSDPEIVAAWWRARPDARVGLLCGERNGISVLDLDLKGGKDGRAALAAAGLQDIEALSPVRVCSPSGGWHLFFKYDPRLGNWANIDPEGKLKPGSIKSGIDVRTQGGHVYAPGSFKGEGERYAPHGSLLGTVELPLFPEALIPPARVIAPPPEIGNVTPYLIEQAMSSLHKRAAELAAMGVDSGRNVELNNIASWAGGAAAHGLLDHDKAKSLLVDAAVQCGMDGGIRTARATFNSGWHFGLANPISVIPGLSPAIDDSDLDDLDDIAPQVDADDEFDSLLSDTEEQGVSIAAMNRKHALIIVGGKSVVAVTGNGAPDFWQLRAFHEFYANRRVEVIDRDTKKRKAVPISQLWMAHSTRRTYPGGIAFAPDGGSDRQFNLWRGWAIDADPSATCDRFLDHVRTVICDGDTALYDYAIGWLAHLVQRPGDKPGVAMVLRGLKGTGKDVVGRYLARMIGGHHVANIAQQDHLVGKFNAHLQSALLVHLEEAIWAGSKGSESVLKNLLTAPTLTIERKNVDSYQARTCFRVMMSSNEHWTVPATVDERRFFVCNVSGARRGDTDYFKALHAEMEGAGPAALLHFLKGYDISDFNVRAVPNGEAMTGQKVASLRGVNLWWFEVLQSDSLPGAWADTWEDELQHVGRDAFREDFSRWVRSHRFESDMDAARFGNAMREMLPAIESEQPRINGTRTRRYVLPKLQDCRDAFAQWIGGEVDWAK